MSELTRRDFQCILDEVAKAIGKYPFDFTYTDLPSQVKAERERLTKIIDDNNAVTKQWVDEAKASLPEPDATNPNHLRWAAKMIEIARPGGDSGIRGGQRNVLADGLRAEADRLDAAQSDEREREQRIEAVAKVLADFTPPLSSPPPRSPKGTTMSDDVRADARRLLQGITPGKWRHCTGPAEGESKAEYLAGCLTNADESLHVVIAQSPAPEYAYVIPALTGDGPTSDANAEFIAAAPRLVAGLLEELDRAEDEIDANWARLILDRDKAQIERDAALATLQQVREIAEEVVNYGGMSVRELADKVVHLADGGAR